MHRRPRRGITLLLLAATLLNACGAHWTPVTMPQQKPLDERVVLEFHARDQLIRLHGVRFEGDSLSGIPWLEHLSCDTCRVHYAVAEISGARTGAPGNAAWGPIVPLAVLLSLAGLAIAGCELSSHCGWGD
ncbi:MAG TPA: hypothetical protein VGI97_01945 [Gemmatimonadaceae bacterium]|jgi:hypothetical protein